MNTTCDSWWIILQVFLFLPERSAFGIIGSGSWYIEGGEKFEGEGRKGLLSQGGCEPPVHYNSTWWALHNHQIVLFSPHKKMSTCNILFFWWKKIFEILEKLELVGEVSGGVLSRGGRDASTLQPPCTHGEHQLTIKLFFLFSQRSIEITCIHFFCVYFLKTEGMLELYGTYYHNDWCLISILCWKGKY